MDPTDILETPSRRGDTSTDISESVKRRRLNETPHKTPSRQLFTGTPGQPTVAMTPRTNRVKQRLAQAAATPRRIREDSGRQLTPRDVLRALSRVMVREKVAMEEEEKDRKEKEPKDALDVLPESQDASPTTTVRSRLSGRLSGRVSDAAGMLGRLSMGSQTPEAGYLEGDMSMVSSRSVELNRRMSAMSRLSNATRISDIYNTTGIDASNGDRTPAMTPARDGEQLPEMDLEFGDEIGGNNDPDSDEDFGGLIVDYDSEDDRIVQEDEGTEEAADGDTDVIDNAVEDDVPTEDDAVDMDLAREVLGGSPLSVVHPDEGDTADMTEDSSIQGDSRLESESAGFGGHEGDYSIHDATIHYSDEEEFNRASLRARTRRTRGSAKTVQQSQPSVFSRNFLKTLVSSITGDVLKGEHIEELVSASELFFAQASNDLAAYAEHGKRKTVESKDVVQLMRRQRIIKESSDILPLAQRHLPAELIAELGDVFTIRAPQRRPSKKKGGVEDDEFKAV